MGGAKSANAISMVSAATITSTDQGVPTRTEVGRGFRYDANLATFDKPINGPLNIQLNVNINWANPEKQQWKSLTANGEYNLLASMRRVVGNSGMNSQDFVDLQILYELSHGLGNFHDKVGPDIFNRSIYDACLKK